MKYQIRQIKHLCVSNKAQFSIESYLGKLKDFFLEISQTDTIFSLFYYFPGAPDKKIQMFLSKQGVAWDVLSYSDRYFDTFSLCQKNEKQCLIPNLKKKLAVTNNLIADGLDDKLLSPNLTLCDQNLIEMTQRLYYTGEELLLELRLATLSKAEIGSLLPRLNAIGAMSGLIHQEKTTPSGMFNWLDTAPEHDYQLTQLMSAIFRYDIRVHSRKGINDHLSSILRKGLGSQHLYPYLKFKDEKNNDTVSCELEETVIHASNAALLFQFPVAYRFYSHIDIEDPPKLPPLMNPCRKGFRLGTVCTNGRDHPVFLSQPDLDRHCYLVGKTGLGKSTTLLNIAVSAIEKGEQAVMVIDPHGDLCADILNQITQQDADRVIYIDFGNTEWFAGINVLEAQTDAEREFAIGMMDDFFLQMYGCEIWGPRIQDLFRNCANMLSLDKGGGTLIDLLWAINLHDPVVRERFENIADQSGQMTLRLFLEQISQYRGREGSLSEIIAYYRSKFSPFIDNLFIRNIVGQSKSTLDFKEIAREKKVCLLNLSKGKLSSRYASLIGSILTIKLFQAAISNVDLPYEKRSPMTVFIDEFQNFVTPAIQDILSEARKYRLSLVLANQFLSQIDYNGPIGTRSCNLTDAVLGNIGTMISFRVSGKDAHLLVDEFGNTVTSHQFTTLPNWEAICKLSHQNSTSPPFIFKTSKMPARRNKRTVQKIIRQSQRQYCRSRKEVDHTVANRLKDRLGLFDTPESPLANLF